MSVNTFAIQSAKVNGTYFSGIQGHAADYGVEMVSPESDGVVHETLHSIARYSPRASFSTLSLATMIAALNGSTDAPIKALDASAGLVLVGSQDATNAPGFTSGTVHEALTALRGMLYMTGISCQGGASPAVMALSAMLSSSDGTTAALIPSQVALPTQPTPAEAFILDAITHNAVALDGFSNLNLSVDCRARQIHSGADIYPKLVTAGPSNGPIRWRLSFDTTDLAFIRAIGAGGSTSALTVTFKQLAQGGTRGATTLTFTFNSRLMITRDAGSGSQGGGMKASVEVLPRWDGTNKPVSWAVA